MEMPAGLDLVVYIVVMEGFLARVIISFQQHLIASVD